MGFNERRMEGERAAAAAKEAAARRALGTQILEDAEHLIATWNARQEAHMPMLFSPTIGAAITARHWFLWVRCPGLLHDAIGRLAQARSPPRRGRDEPHSLAVVPLVPAACAVRAARSVSATQHRR
jgi:hypothetical protein